MANLSKANLCKAINLIEAELDEACVVKSGNPRQLLKGLTSPMKNFR